MPDFPQLQNVNAQHAPTGCGSSFTLGTPGAGGGLDVLLGRPAGEEFWIGYGRVGEDLHVLPFHGAVTREEERRFALENEAATGPQLQTIAARRILDGCVDRWVAHNFSMTVFGPHMHAPEPGKATEAEMQMAYFPGIPLQIEFHNTDLSAAQVVFLGWKGSDPRASMRPLPTGLAGMANGPHRAIVSMESDAWISFDFSVEKALQRGQDRSRHWGLGTCGVIAVQVPPGESRILRLGMCFHEGPGSLQSMDGLDIQAFYKRWFADLVQVARAMPDHWQQLVELCQSSQKWLENHTVSLSDHRRFLLGQALRGYYANTVLYDTARGPLWMVLEGEYRMFNTLDLAVDQVFWESERHPWSVRNVLEWMWTRFRYEDRAVLPSGRMVDGGVAFAHDMGAVDMLAAPGQSAYERPGVHGCFSFMSAEELVNWILCALKVTSEADVEWLPRLQVCMQSLLGRDDTLAPTGLIQGDGELCGGGSEITTYDSLDSSLGHARGSLYLAVKTWVAWLALAARFAKSGQQEEAGLARRMADLSCKTILSSRGFCTQSPELFPAVLDGSVASPILPAIEGLVFLDLCEPLDDRHGELANALLEHARVALEQGCRFADGGWKLSASASNSWLSKIFICQSVLERLGKQPRDVQADAAHVSWLCASDNAPWAFSDQMVDGIAQGSRYYPRGVTAWLFRDQAANCP